MSFTQAISSGFRQYVGFGGRASRSEYWWFFLFGALVGWTAVLVDNSGVLSGLVTLGLFLPGVAVAVRRLHDTGRSGWWLLIALVPLLGVIVLLVFLASSGNPQSNRFGPPHNDQLQKVDPATGAPPPPPLTADRMACPHCGESIAALARVCRFCGHELVRS